MAFRSSAQTGAVRDWTIVVNLPAGMVVGDYLLVAISRHYNANYQTWSPPAGWTEFAWYDSISPTTYPCEVHYFWRYVDGTEGTTASFTDTYGGGTTHLMSAQALAFSGRGTAAAHNTIYSHTSAITVLPTTFTANSGTANSGDDAVSFSFYAGYQPDTWTTPSAVWGGPSGWVDCSNSNFDVGVFTKDNVGAGTLAPGVQQLTTYTDFSGFDPHFHSRLILLPVQPPQPVFVGAPADQQADDGGTATFSVVVQNFGSSPTYQWQDNRTGSFANTADGTGATTATYTTPTLDGAANARQYRCVFTDSNGTVTSPTARLRVVFNVFLFSTAIPAGNDVWVRNPLHLAQPSIALTGGANAVATATGTFNTQIAGSAAAVATATGALANPYVFIGAAVATATGSLNTTPPGALAFKYDANAAWPTSGRYIHGTGTLTLSIKAGLINDMIVVGFISDATTITPADIGWQLLLKIPLTGAAAIYDMGRSLSVYYRKDLKGNGDVTGYPDTYDFVTAGGGYAQTVWTCSRWRNANWDTYDPVAPFEAIRISHPVAGAGSGDWVWNSGTGVMVGTIPSIDALDANDAVLYFWADQDFSAANESTRSFTARLTDISSDYQQYGAFAPEDYIRCQYEMLSSAGAIGDAVQTIQPGLAPPSTNHPNYNRLAANIAIVLRSQLAAGALFHGAAVATATASSTIYTLPPGSIATTSTATAKATGALTTLPAALAATPTATATATGYMVMPSAVLATTPASTALLTGDLTVQTRFADTAASLATAVGELTTSILFASTPSAVSTATGQLTVGAKFVGAAVAVATASLDVRWEVSAKAAATATAVLLASIRAAAAATCQATATGTLGPFVAVREGITVRLGTNELTAHVASPIELTANDFLVLS